MKCVMKTVVFFVIICTSISIEAQTTFSYSSNFLSGFEKELSGETINYYTQGAQAIDALLVRSFDSKNFIEWETQPVTAENKNSDLVFVMMASLQVTKDSHRFDIYLNGTKYFSFNNPREKSLNPIIVNGINGARMEYSNLEYDRFEDLTGFLFFYLSAKDFPNGKPILVRIEGETANSRSWFMVFKHSCRSNAVLSNENVILNSPGTSRQSMRVKIFHMMPPSKASIRIGGNETQFDLKFGFNYLHAGFEKITGEKELPIEFKIDNKIIGNTTYIFKPVTPITIYLLPHSHVDIGYTNVQDEVEKLQWQHLEDAIDLSEQTSNYPAGARFKWNAEVLWAVDSYLSSANPQKQQELINAIQKNQIGVDGLYANILTGLCSPEEWIWLAEAVRNINNKCGIKIESAMISDIPGWSRSLVTMLAHSGIKYLSCGINQGDRIGSIRKELGDKPFYWISPSGKEKVLTWVHEQGYSAFHYVPKSGSASLSVIEPTIINYTNKLADDNYPFDLVPLHYTIGSDNGPVDKYLSDNVKEWNELYESPKLVIATTAEFFREFEKKYQDKLPEISGDITPYWEDGAASSARETALNRQTADRLTQTMNLFSQYAPSECPVDSFANAWRNVILYDEHTWGSWNSIDDPESDFTKQQWKIKQLFATNAAKQADELFKSLKNVLSISDCNNDALEVFNSSSQTRTDLVRVPEIIASKINSVLSIVDENGNAVPTQQLSDGSFVFIASEIPAFGSKRYFFGKAKAQMQFIPVSVDNGKIKNEFLSLEIDTVRGILRSIKLADSKKNLVDSTNSWGFGNYLYVNGRKPDNPLPGEKVKIKIKEKGPLVSSWIIESKAPGCDFIEQEIKVTAGVNRVELICTIDKQKIYSPEAVRFSFPFNVPNGVVSIENAFGFYQPEAEQIKGSCKNFFTLNNYVDISNQELGISLISPDAPLIEIGKMTNDAKAIGWLDTCSKGTTLYSFVMNNYWHTNFCATQEGRTNFRYILYPHKSFNSTEATSQGIFAEQPLLVIPVNKNAESFAPLVKYNNENVFIVSAQPIEGGNKTWISLYNASAKANNLQFIFSKNPRGLYESDLIKNKFGNVGSSVSIPGKDLKCILIEW
jgi:alpha-mannosidase